MSEKKKKKKKIIVDARKEMINVVGHRWFCIKSERIFCRFRVAWGEMDHVGYSNEWSILPAMPISPHPTLLIL